MRFVPILAALVVGLMAVPAVTHAASVQLSAPTYVAIENSRTLSVPIVSSGEDGVDVTLQTVGESAVAGEDFISKRQRVKLAKAGQPVVVTVVIQIREDQIVESDETFRVELVDASSGAKLADPSTATVTIQDNDRSGIFQYFATSQSVNEKAGLATVTVWRSGGAAGEVSVDYATGGGDATPEVDYRRTSGTLLFETNRTLKSFTVPILDDELEEGAESIGLAIGNPLGGATLGPRRTSTIAIVDDEVKGRVRFSAPTYTATEASDAAAITVLRTAGSSGRATVKWEATAGTASAKTDFRESKGEVTLRDGQLAGTFRVPIRTDTRGEPDETVKLRLHSPGGGVTLASPSTAVLTIRDDDVSAASTPRLIYQGPKRQHAAKRAGVISLLRAEYAMTLSVTGRIAVRGKAPRGRKQGKLLASYGLKSTKRRLPRGVRVRLLHRWEKRAFRRSVRRALRKNRAVTAELTFRATDDLKRRVTVKRTVTVVP